MEDLWAILGHDQLADEIADVLTAGRDLPVIQGAPGTGKSALAQQIGGLWEESKGSAIVALGDHLQSEVDFYPLTSALAPLTKEWRIWARAMSSAAPAGESLALGTGGKISAVVRALSGLRRRTRKARRLLLGDEEQQILFDLERRSGKKPLLLIVDNLHWWDRESLALLGRLLEPRMREAFPFLLKMRVLAAQTPPPDQHVAHPDAHGSLLRPDRTKYFSLTRAGREGFDEVLRKLGAPSDLAPATYESVHRLTGGHLALARRCAERLADEETDRAQFLAQMESGDFVDRLLTERIQSLGPFGQEAVQLLQTAAVLGLSFRRDVIECATGESQAPVGKLLRYCRSQDMLEIHRDSARFVHDLYREHFLNSTNFDQVAVHERLDSCFRELRPSDYQLRCENALKAEMETSAAALAVQAVISAHRNGQSRSELRPAVEGALSLAPVGRIVKSLSESLDSLDRADSRSALDALSKVPHDLPPVIQAEVDLISASALMLTRSGPDRQSALSMLDRWSNVGLPDTALQARILRAQLYGRALEPDNGAAFALEDELRTLLTGRAAVDASAADELYTLDRCAAAVHPPDVAESRVKRAVDHFASGEDETLRRPAEYYFALMNLVAEHIVAGRFQDAVNVSEILDSLVDDFEPGTFQKLDFPRSNQLLAQFRLGAVSPDQAADFQREIIDRHTSDDDPFYPGNALAIYEAFAGRTAAAVEIYDELLDTLGHRNKPEASITYVLRANRCAIRFVSGDWDGVLEEWIELDSIVRQITYPIVDFYTKRHELLLGVISDGGSWTMESFDTCLTAGGRQEIGPQWSQLGRGFRLPEIMWWL